MEPFDRDELQRLICEEAVLLRRLSGPAALADPIERGRAQRRIKEIEHRRCELLLRRAAAFDVVA